MSDDRFSDLSDYQSQQAPHLKIYFSKTYVRLLENDKIDIRNCFIIRIKFGSINFEREWENTAMIARPINRIYNFVFSLCTITQFQIVWFEFCVEPFQQTLSPKFNLVVNISETAISLFLAWTASAQSFNCNNVFSSLNLSCSRVKQLKSASISREFPKLCSITTRSICKSG